MRNLMCLIGILSLVACDGGSNENSTSDATATQEVTAQQEEEGPYAVNPGDSGFSQEKLDEIQVFMETAVQEERIPSGIAMIARAGKIAWLGTAGEMGPNV